MFVFDLFVCSFDASATFRRGKSLDETKKVSSYLTTGRKSICVKLRWLPRQSKKRWLEDNTQTGYVLTVGPHKALILPGSVSCPGKSYLARNS